MDAFRSATERILGETLGSSVSVAGEPQVLKSMMNGYVTVVRCQLTGPSEAPETVVAKRPGDWAPYEPDSIEGTAWGFLNECAALELLQDAEPCVVPRLYGADRSAGVLVMEDLGDGDGLAGSPPER